LNEETGLLVEVIPGVGIYGIKLSEDRSQVLQVLSEPAKRFQRSQRSKVWTDMYPDIGLMIDYDSSERVEFIQVVPPSEPTFRGIYFIGRPVSDVITELAAFGYDPQFDNDSSYRLDDIGIALYVPYDEVDSVAIYAKGYYDVYPNDF
jgi:hypothetical protein